MPPSASARPPTQTAQRVPSAVSMVGPAGLAAGGAAVGEPRLAASMARQLPGSAGRRFRRAQPQPRRQPQRWRRLPSARLERNGPGSRRSGGVCRRLAPAPVTVTFSRCARKAVRKPSRSNSRTRKRCCWRQTTIASTTIATIAIRGVGSQKTSPAPRSYSVCACSASPIQGAAPLQQRRSTSNLSWRFGGD